MSGVWGGPPPRNLYFNGPKFETGPMPPPHTPQPGNIERSVFASRALRRVEIEDDYVITHQSWGSAVLPKCQLTITLEADYPHEWGGSKPWIMSPGYQMPAPKHTCPLTEAEPGTAMLYACPVCSGSWC